LPILGEKMKLKITHNTVFHDLTRTYSTLERISILEFKNRLKYSFNGEDLEEVIRVETEMKRSFVHFKIHTASGIHKAQAKLGYINDHSISIDHAHQWYGYRSVEDFIKDFLASTNDDFRILKQYRYQLLKKEKQMKEVTQVLDRVSMKHPEFFL